LDALTVGLETRKVNWVLDADIRGFFDTLSHEWLVKFVEHRIGDPRVIRHIKKWLNAGVMDEGKRMDTSEGTPQGGSISPLLANVYLHYAFDVWADQWRRTQASGDVIIVRYADDFVVGFEHREEAERFQRELGQRLERFNLELHPEKTRLIEFGRQASENRRRRGEGRPATFDFLGLTHSCGRDRKGRFIVLRQTMRKRLRAKLAEIRQSLRQRMHEGLRQTGRWLGVVVQGHYRYYGVPRNGPALKSFRFEVIRLWRQVLGRRSQRGKPDWQGMYRLGRRWVPLPTICHPYPNQRLRVSIQGKSPVR
jgi:RNA-directed DNA polymerase